MTVSLALRNQASIPVATRQRIQALARELGYSPDPVVAAHMLRVRARLPIKQTGTIAFLTAHSTRDGWWQAGNIHRDYFAGAARRASERGYRLEEIWAREPGMTARRLSTILLSRGIHGLLLAPLAAARGHLTLDWSQFAVATVGYSVWRPNFHRAIVNYFHMVGTAFRQLRRLGYRRIGLEVNRGSNERADRLYLAALLACQLRVRKEDRVPALLPRVGSERLFRPWFERHRPDAIITAHPECLSWIRSYRLRVPQDVGLVHLVSCEAPRGWAAIDTHAEVIGATAVDLVINQLQRNECGVPRDPQTVMIEPHWVDGHTARTRKR